MLKLQAGSILPDLPESRPAARGKRETIRPQIPLRQGPLHLGIVIPAFDEEDSVALVVKRCLRSAPASSLLRVVVSDNASRDRTAEVAAGAGAEVVRVARRGYGAACQGGIDHLGDWPDILVFLDADGSSRPEELDQLLAPVAGDSADLVIGCRPSGCPMTLPQRFGTWLAVALVNRLWKTRFKDTGPFRAIRRIDFERLGMRDRTWGWTVEMQILATRLGLRISEVPVSWEQRTAGSSKISGTVSGVVRAGTRIIWTIVSYALCHKPKAVSSQAIDSSGTIAGASSLRDSG